MCKWESLKNYKSLTTLEGWSSSSLPPLLTTQLPSSPKVCAACGGRKARLCEGLENNDGKIRVLRQRLTHRLTWL